MKQKQDSKNNGKEEYTEIYDKIVLPFIRKNIKKDYLSEPVYYLLENLKINRFRSAIPIIFAREFNIDEDLTLPIAAFSELTFTTAMAQDDYYDEDISREGIEACHIKYGIKHTMLSCDYVNHQIISIVEKYLIEKKVSDLERAKILFIMNEAMKSWYLSVLYEKNSVKNLNSINLDYLNEIYLGKTVHANAGLECAMILLKNNKNYLDKIREYCKLTSISGQLKNDIYDFTKHSKYRGLSDLKNKHITYPLYLLIKSLDTNQIKELLDDLNYNRNEKIIKLFRKKNIVEKILKLIDSNVLEAKNRIRGVFPRNIEDILNTRAERNRTFSRKPRI